MTRQASLKKQLKTDYVGVLPMEYCKPSKDLELVFHKENGELQRGQGKRPNGNVVILY